MYPNDQKVIYEFNSVTGNFITKTIPLTESSEQPNEIYAFSSNLFDILMLVIICNNHGRILLQQFSKEQLYFLPIFPLKYSL